MSTGDYDIVGGYLSRSLAAIESIDLESAAQILEVILEARATGRVVYIAGNGGSASTASHYVVDLMKTSSIVHGQFVKAISLTDNTSTLTALGNDVQYSEVFSKQIEWLVEPGDVFIAISASGTSPNIINAVVAASLQGATTIGITGFGGGELADIADHCLVIDSSEDGPVEDAHLVVGHMITSALMQTSVIK